MFDGGGGNKFNNSNGLIKSFNGNGLNQFDDSNGLIKSFDGSCGNQFDDEDLMAVASTNLTMASGS